MSPATHLFASWIVAAKTTDNLRDRRLVALSGLLPDLDGLGIFADYARLATSGNDDFFYYQRYHHFLLHGIWGAAAIAIVMACLAGRRWHVAVLSFAVVHLHLLCDLIGSRGPSAEDLWPIFYLAPASKQWMWIWHHQWALNGWPNRVISVVLFAWCLRLAVRNGDSVVGVFNRRADAVFVSVLRRVSHRTVGGPPYSGRHPPSGASRST